MSEKPKTKHWQFRGGERKAVSFKLPITTIEKLDALAEKLDTSKTNVLIEAIDDLEREDNERADALADIHADEHPSA